jgi:hypothetical protein
MHWKTLVAKAGYSAQVARLKKRQAEVRPSFLKKRSKKLLIMSASAHPDKLSQMCKSFLVLFFKKEHACFK